MPTLERDAMASSAAEEQPLVAPELWHTLAADLDPFPSHRPAQIDCGIAGYYAELNALEIDTTRCNYLAIEQPALHAVRVDDELVVQLAHFDLTAPAPAQAHAALSFDADVQWEVTIPIPHPADVLSVSVPATRALAVGDPIRFHLHNHGQNTWLLVAISVVR